MHRRRRSSPTRRRNLSIPSRSALRTVFPDPHDHTKSAVEARRDHDVRYRRRPPRRRPWPTVITSSEAASAAVASKPRRPGGTESVEVAPAVPSPPTGTLCSLARVLVVGVGGPCSVARCGRRAVPRAEGAVTSPSPSCWPRAWRDPVAEAGRAPPDDMTDAPAAPVFVPVNRQAGRRSPRRCRLPRPPPAAPHGSPPEPVLPTSDDPHSLAAIARATAATPHSLSRSALPGVRRRRWKDGRPAGARGKGPGWRSRVWWMCSC